MSQRDVAKATGISQQELSRIEQVGFVPKDDKLARLCDALHVPIREVEVIIAGATTADSRAQSLERELLNFQETLIQRANASHRLDVYVIRDDAEPSDHAAATMHSDIFAVSKRIFITILFRHSDRSVWESFRLLAARVAKKCVPGLADIEGRLRGYYRHPDWEEDRHKELPLTLPAVVLRDDHEMSLWVYGVDELLMARLRESGVEQWVARDKSIVILPQLVDRQKAERFSGWIGPDGQAGLDGTLWVPIPWPMPH